MQLQFEHGRLEIFSSGGQYGEAQEVVDIAYAGSTLRLGFNSQYLLDFFAVAKTETVRIELKDDQSGVQFPRSTRAHYGYKYILMPMRA